MEKKTNKPSFKGNGVTIWTNTAKNGNKYLSVKILENKSVPCWEYKTND